MVVARLMKGVELIVLWVVEWLLLCIRERLIGTIATATTAARGLCSIDIDAAPNPFTQTYPNPCPCPCPCPCPSTAQERMRHRHPLVRQQKEPPRPVARQRAPPVKPTAPLAPQVTDFEGGWQGGLRGGGWQGGL